MWIFGFVLQLGRDHILNAELYAILTGLKLAWSQGYRKVIVESDSLLAVNKINQPLQAKDPFK